MNITVVMTHWPRHVARFEYFVQAVSALFDKLPASTTEHKFHFLVGIETDYVESPDLLRAVVSYCKHRGLHMVQNTGYPSLGRLLNMTLHRVASELVLYVQDDFILQNPLHLDADVEFLRSPYNSFSVMRYSSNPKTVADAPKIPDHPEWCMPEPGSFYYWSFNPFLALTEPLRTFFGPFAEERHAENQTNLELRSKPPVHRIAVYSKAYRKGKALFFKHIGRKTAMLEKFPDEELHRHFGDTIPPRLTELPY